MLFNKQISRFVVKPNENTTWHNHHETEVFIIISGIGLANIDGQDIKLEPGNIIELSPLTTHIIYNTSDTNNLVICNIWWNENERFHHAMKNKCLTTEDNLERDSIHFILPSFTTPNGNLHIGHIAGPLLAADILKRMYKLNHINAYLLSGTIGHQTQVQVAADKLGKTYTETALLYSENIKNSLDLIDIKTDCFVTLKDKEKLVELSNRFIQTLFEKSLLNLREDDVYYCNDCAKYLFEANVIGNCPHCNYPVNAECEKCYEYFPEKQLKNPVCITCKKTPHLKKLSRYYFSLNEYKYIIENLYFKNSYTGISKSFIEKMLHKELPDIPMTIIANNGIPFSHNNFNGHVLYSAIELVPRFLVAIQVLCEDKSQHEWEYFLNHANVVLDLLFGVDNLYLRCIIFPILLSAFNDNLVNKIHFIANDFYCLEDTKFSTSRKHVISVENAEEMMELDYLRYYLVMTRPELHSTQFKKNEISEWITNGSIKQYTNLANKLENIIAETFNHITPEAGSWDNFHYAYQHFLDSTIQLALSYNNAINLVSYTNLLNTIIEVTVNFFETGIRFEMSESYRRTFYALCIKGVFSISILLSPICPNIARNIQSNFYPSSTQQFFGVECLNQWILTKLNVVNEVIT